MRYIPFLRDEACVGGLPLLRQQETRFQKEEYDKGYHVLKQNTNDEYLYFIFKGKCRLLLSTRLDLMSNVFSKDIQRQHEWLVLDTLHKGQCFGEITSIDKMPAPYTVEVCSETATILKIHINDFKWYFGG